MSALTGKLFLIIYGTHLVGFTYVFAQGLYTYKIVMILTGGMKIYIYMYTFFLKMNL